MDVFNLHGDEWDVECEVRPLASPEMGAAHQR